MGEKTSGLAPRRKMMLLAEKSENSNPELTLIHYNLSIANSMRPWLSSA
jgi:hypothetical protein